MEYTKKAYLRKIKKEEEEGIYRQTVAEIIEEERAAKRLRKKMESKEKEESENAEKLKEKHLSLSTYRLLDRPTFLQTPMHRPKRLI